MSLRNFRILVINFSLIEIIFIFPNLNSSILIYTIKIYTPYAKLVIDFLDTALLQLDFKSFHKILELRLQ